MPSRSRLICASLVGVLLSQVAGCGTLFYPERRGQITGSVDPAIVVLDALGLLFYIIPGVIALGVDFASGAVYYPDNKYSVAPEVLKQAVGDDGRVDPVKLKAILERETGRELPLDDPRMIQHTGSVDQLASYGLVPRA